MKTLTVGLALVGSLAASTAAHADGSLNSTLYEGDYLFQGQRVVADGGFYHLEMHTDGNLVLYGGAGASAPEWSTGTNQKCVGVSVWPFQSCFTAAAAYATLQSDGNFVVYWAAGDAAWATNTAGGAGSNDAQLWMQQDGNLVEYRWSGSSEAVWWASNTAGFAVEGSQRQPCRNLL